MGATVTTDAITNHTIGRATNDVLEQAAKVVLKDEDEVDGQTVGPVWIVTADGQHHPYHRADGIEWFPASFAEALANTLGVPCEVA